MSAVFRREMRGFLVTPAGWAFLIMYTLLAGVVTVFINIGQEMSASVNLTLSAMQLPFLLISPLLTMRMFAEERRMRTDQLLLTSPGSLPGIVLGKYLAAVTVLCLTGLATLLYVAVVAIYGTVYPAELAVNYLGFLLQGCAFVALDLYLGSWAGTPVVAAVMGFGANLLIWIMDLAADQIGITAVEKGIEFFSLYGRNEPFLMGQLSFANAVYDISFAAA